MDTQFQDPTVKTFISNLKKAIRDREMVEIGGGEFYNEELRIILAALEETQGNKNV